MSPRRLPVNRNATVGGPLLPRHQEVVGADGVAKLALAKVLPKVSEKIGAKQRRHTQMEKPPAAGDSPGAVRSPMREGTGVSAGRRS